MTSKNLAYAGAALLAAGLFTPIVSMPIVGSVNLFNNGSNVLALILILLGGGSAVLAAQGRERDALWPGVAAAAILIYAFGRLQYSLAQMRDTIAKELDGNPFAGLANAAVGSVQLQWGWLVLAGGAGLIVAAGMTARKQQVGDGTDAPARGGSRPILIVSALAVLVAVGWDAVRQSGSPASPSAATGGQATRSAGSAAASPVAADQTGPSAEEAAYIAQHLQLYDLEAKYYDSMLEGRIPGVDFKLKNSGGRTLNEVDVRVEFLDGEGKAIAEETYYPVLPSGSSFSSNNTPLRPNYIWQNEPNEFYQAKSVPSEWAEGKARATIVDIEFAPASASR